MKHLFVSLLVASLAFSSLAKADLLLDGFEQGFRFNFGPYQIAGFRAQATNTGAELDHVIGRISSGDAELTLIGRRLWFGNIDAFATRRSFNGFLIIAPRTADLSDAALIAQIDVNYEFDFHVTLQAQVIDEPIPNAVVTVDNGEEQTTVVADVLGNYTVDLSLSNFDDFITLDATGGPGQEFVALRSLAGTVGELHNATGTVGGASTLTAAQVQSLDVTHVTTAKAVLAENANSGAITSTEELAAAELAIDTLELLRLATTIKLIIDDPGIALPAGFATTLELVQNSAAADAFAAELLATSGEAYNAALAATLEGASSGGFVASDINEAIYSTILRNPGVIVGDELIFREDGTAQRTDASGTIDATWTITPEGTLSFVPVGGQFVRPNVGFVFGCAENPNVVVAVQTVYLGSEFSLILRGGAVDLVSEASDTSRQYPNNPECSTTSPQTSPPSIAFRWVGESGSLDYTAADFSDRELVLNFWSTEGTRPILGNAIREAGQDFFTFNANGTGSTRITGRNFLWAIGASGHLEVTMATGEFNEYVSLGTDIDGDINSAINIGITPNGRFAFRSFQLEVDPAFMLSPASFVGPTFISGSGEQSTFSPRVNQRPSEFLFNADGSWLQNGMVPFGDPNAAWSNPGGRLEFTLSTGSSRQDVSWAPVALIGDRYWVLEARQLGPAIDPQFVDLGTATGFLTYYRATP